MLLSSAATSSWAIVLSRRLLGVLRQVLEDGCGVLAREHAKDDDLILEAERRQQLGDLAGVPVAQHVAQARVVAGAQHGGEFFGRLRHVADGGEALCRVLGR